LTHSHFQKTPENGVRALRRILRQGALDCALATALCAASAAPSAWPAYALKSDGVRIARDGTRADRNPMDDDPSVIVALWRKCPDILGDPSDYDDDLIALCLKAQRRP
jgi:hypothetical protein